MLSGLLCLLSALQIQEKEKKENICPRADKKIFLISLLHSTIQYFDFNKLCRPVHLGLISDLYDVPRCMAKVTLGQVKVSWEEGNTNHNHTVSTILIPRNEIVKLRSRSRSGEGQVRVRKVRDRSESGKAQLRT